MRVAANADRWSPRLPPRALRAGGARVRSAVSPDPWSLHRAGPLLRVTVSNDAGPSDFELLLEAILSEIRAGARDIVLGGPGMEHPSSAAAAFVRLFLGYRRDLGISIRLDPPQDPPVTPGDR
jgi:hypothetical protein